MTKIVSNDSQVYAVVVNWNNPMDTITCVNSLFNQKGVTVKVVVVDNGSTDDSVSIIRGEFPQVELISNPTNLKFAGGYNLGMHRALERGAETIFIINNDAFLAPDGLATMLLHIAPDIGAVAPMIYYYDQPNRIWSIGGRINQWTLETSNDSQDSIDTGEWPPVIEQDVVTGCCMLFNRRAVEEVGLFDENFVHYYEDIDICRRLRLAGYSILVIPRAKAWHKVALSSGGKDSPDERYWMARSSVHFFRKHGLGGHLFIIAPYRFGSAIKTSLRLLTHHRSDSLRAYWHGLLDGLQDSN